MYLIYSLTIPITQDVTKFIEFIEKKYFPAVYMGPTRVGQVSGLKLLSNSDVPYETADKHSFFVFADWGGLPGGRIRVEDNAVTAELEKFGAVMTKIGTFDEAASFSSPD